MHRIRLRRTRVKRVGQHQIASSAAGSGGAAPRRAWPCAPPRSGPRPATGEHDAGIGRAGIAHQRLFWTETSASPSLRLRLRGAFGSIVSGVVHLHGIEGRNVLRESQGSQRQVRGHAHERLDLDDFAIADANCGRRSEGLLGRDDVRADEEACRRAWATYRRTLAVPAGAEACSARLREGQPRHPALYRLPSRSAPRRTGRSGRCLPASAG